MSYKSDRPVAHSELCHQQNKPFKIYWGVFFDHIPEIRFGSCFKCYENLFQVEFANRHNEWKIQLLLRKFSITDYEKYLHFILPYRLHDFNFKDTIDIVLDFRRPVFTFQYAIPMYEANKTGN